MPYINKNDRQYFDEELSSLIAKVKTIQEREKDPRVVAGLLNYLCSQLALGCIPERRYWSIALITGALHNAADEFYRRYAVPFENDAIKRNGDIY